MYSEPRTWRRSVTKQESNAKMLIWFSPAGIEKMFARMAAKPEKYVEIGAEHGVEFVEET